MRLLQVSLGPHRSSKEESSGVADARLFTSPMFFLPLTQQCRDTEGIVLYSVLSLVLVLIFSRIVVLPSVLCRCWLGDRMGIRPVKIFG